MWVDRTGQWPSSATIVSDDPCQPWTSRREGSVWVFVIPRPLREILGHSHCSCVTAPWEFPTSMREASAHLLPPSCASGRERPPDHGLMRRCQPSSASGAEVAPIHTVSPWCPQISWMIKAVLQPIRISQVLFYWGAYSSAEPSWWTQLWIFGRRYTFQGMNSSPFWRMMVLNRVETRS